MDLENAIQANVKQVMSSKQAKQLAHFASISVLIAIQMTLDNALNVGKLVIKTLLIYV